MMMITRCASALAILLVSACASPGDFPSLAKRPFEDGSAVAAATTPPPATLDATMLARVARALESARDSRSAFASGYQIAAAAVSAGSPIGSEAWISGQLAISRLEPLRAPAQSALAVIVDEQRKLATGASIMDTAEVSAAFAEVESIRNDQAQKADDLLARLSRP